MTKNAFLCGLGLGLVLGTYLIKTCPSLSSAYDSAEHNIKCKVNDIKQKMHQKKEEQCCHHENQTSENVNDITQ